MFEEVPSLCPAQFFSISADALFLSKGILKKEKRYLLPSTADFLDEESFADVYAAWNFDKLMFFVDVKAAFQGMNESDLTRGDTVELFLDTRDLKTKGAISKFCHHFIFFAAALQGFYGRECTRFRGDDIHPLCHPEDLIVTPTVKGNGYTLNIEIPASCLSGFDPMSFSRLGFTYRINRTNGPSQHFAVSSDEHAIEQHPATWGTLKLVKED